jgi:hypothetical protein
MTHCPGSAGAAVVKLLISKGNIVSFAPRGFELEPHGVVRSDRRTPFSLASCSRVIGMKDPEYCQYT